MSEWKELKLDALGKVARGKSKHRPRNAPELFGGKYPFIQTGDIKEANFYVTKYSETYSEVGLAQSKLWKKGTLCITIAANIAETAILGIDACFPDSIIGFLPYQDKSDVRFIKYQFDLIKKHLQSISQGTTQDNLSQGKLLKFNFKAPELPEQHRIASILSTYDELIENNNRRIAILEQTAEQIYKEWFVRMRFPGYENTEFEKGVPKGWEVKKLKQIVSTQYGYTASADMEIEGPNFLRITDIANSYIDWSNVPYCPINENEIEKYKLKFGDIVVARTGATAGYAKRIHKNHPSSVFASYLVRIKLKDLRLNYYVGLIVESTTYKDFIMSIAGGAAQPQANANVLTELSVFVPDISIIEKFNNIVEPIFDQIENLRNQNQNLIQTRDLLLPRLISGKLKVKEVEKI